MFILRYRNLTTEQLDELDNRPVENNLILRCHKAVSKNTKRMVVTRMPEFENDNVFSVEATNLEGETIIRNYVQTQCDYGTYPKLYDILDQLTGYKLDKFLAWGEQQS